MRLILIGWAIFISVAQFHFHVDCQTDVLLIVARSLIDATRTPFNAHTDNLRARARASAHICI